MSRIVKLTKIAIIVLILFKIAVLPLGSYPFDFAAFVYQARTFFEYGINPLFYLNKGMPIIALFYLPYSMYSLVMSFLGGHENILLLHAIYKLPLLLLDLSTAILLWKILDKFVNNKALKGIGVMLWLANPFVFWMTEFQGQYAIYVVFFLVLGVYFTLVKNKLFLAVASFAVATSIYYFPVIFLPFLVLWFARNNLKAKNILSKTAKTLSSFAASLVVLYLPFLLMPSFLSGLINSILHHSAPDAPQNQTEISVPLYSLFRLPFFLFTHEWPSNTASPLYFKVVSIMTFVGLILIVAYSLHRILATVKSKKYSVDAFLVDIIITLTIFVVLIGKLQSHYLLWLMPLYVLAITVMRIKNILPMYIFMGALPILVILGYTNLSVFLVDILPWNSIFLYLGHDDYTQALGGFLIVGMLVSMTVFINNRHRSIDLGIIKKNFIIIWAVFFVLMLAMTVSSYYLIAKDGQSDKLASEKLVYNYSFISKSEINENSELRSTSLNMPDASFEGDYPSTPNDAGYFNKKTSPWYLYNYGNPKSLTATITNEDKNTGSKSLKLEAKANSASAQVAVAKEDLMIPVNKNSIYSVSGSLKAVNIKGGKGSLVVRFAYPDKKIISGSDITITELDGTTDWGAFQKEIQVPEAADYMQILVSLSENANDKIQPGSTLFADDINVSKTEQDRLYTYQQLTPKGNKPAIYSNILESPETQNKFQFSFRVTTVPVYGSVTDASLNACTANFHKEEKTAADSTNKNDNYAVTFPSTCFDTHSEDNTLKIKTINLEYPDPKMALMHISKEYEVPSRRKIIMVSLAAIGTVIVMVFLIVLTREYAKIFKRYKA